MFGMASATPHPSIDLGQRFSSQAPTIHASLFIRRGEASWQRSSLNVSVVLNGAKTSVSLKINSGMDYWHLADIPRGTAHVRYWHKADINLSAPMSAFAVAFGGKADTG